ncbi:hypothetical protein Srufu_041400 [Streptomyces libani subsp. rufus]|nr:hypothetical protein Srufu_041400 [Streptomyces libani subsp. rufus]
MLTVEFPSYGPCHPPPHPPRRGNPDGEDAGKVSPGATFDRAGRLRATAAVSSWAGQAAPGHGGRSAR